MLRGKVAHAHSDWALHVAADSRGTSIVSTSLDGTARVSTPARDRLLVLPAAALQCAVSERGGVVLALRDGTVRTYDGSSMRETHAARRARMRGAVGAAVTADGGATLACFTGGASHALVLRNARSGAEAAVEGAGRGAGVRITADGSRLAYVAGGRAVLADARFAPIAAVPAAGDAGLAIADGARRVAVADATRLRVIDPRADTVLTLPGYDPPGRYGRCAIAADGARVVAAERDGFGVWDASGRKIAKLSAGAASFNNGCALSAAGDTVVTAASDGKVRVWGAVTGVGRFIRERETRGDARWWRSPRAVHAT